MMSSREAHRDPTPPGIRNTKPLVGPLVQSNEVEDLRDGALVLTPLDQAGVGITAPRSWYPMKDRPILNLKFFHLTVGKLRPRWRLHLHSLMHPVGSQRGSQGHVLPCMSGAPTSPIP